MQFLTPCSVLDDQEQITPLLRRLGLEVMEDRRLLAAMGPVDPANSAGWQAVIVELKADSGNVQDVAPRLLHASSGRLDHSCGHELLDPTN